MDWVVGGIVSGDVLSAVVEAVEWLEWGFCVVVSVIVKGPGDRLAGEWLLDGVLIRVAVRRCRMCCMMWVASASFVLALGCGAVGWRLWGALLVCVSM